MAKAEAKKPAPAKAAPAPEAKPAPAAVEAPKVYEYLCPLCGKVAIQTSNKMLGVKVTCQSCGKDIKLDNKEKYRKIAK